MKMIPEQKKKKMISQTITCPNSSENSSSFFGLDDSLLTKLLIWVVVIYRDELNWFCPPVFLAVIIFLAIASGVSFFRRVLLPQIFDKRISWPLYPVVHFSNWKSATNFKELRCCTRTWYVGSHAEGWPVLLNITRSNLTVNSFH